MKRFLSLSFLFITVSMFAQTPYIDYETVGNDWVFNIFSQGTGGMYDVVANPSKGGINTSDSCAMLTVGIDGDPWAGVWSSDFPDLTLDNTNCIISVMVYKDTISNFNLKLEPPNVDHNVPNTLINQWEQLVFDYTSDIGTTAQTLTIIPDFPPSRYHASVNYWDNIDFSGTIVPVELTSFTGKYVGNTVQLKWSTATELNNLGFDVQRSIAGKPFVSVGFVQGKGTTTEKNNYTYVDNSISPNTVYSYRLKQIDLDGSYSFAGVVNLGKSLPLHFELNQNYPNPFNPSTKISFDLPVNSNISLDIYNLVGEKVMSIYKGELEAGNHTYNVNGSDLSSGIYVYRLTVAAEDGTNFVASKKMTLLK
jgi:hypothetical protein